MKFDTIIMGGGLTGLTCGIALQQAGQHVAIISAGQSSLHFASGSFDLLGFDCDGNPVHNPLTAIESLPSSHPYKKVGNVEALALEAQDLLAQAGITTTGSPSLNHQRLTPIGATAPTWLSLDGFFTLEAGSSPYRKVILMNISGFLDFPTQLIAHGLREMGVEVSIVPITLHQLAELRTSATEMRATNIAKVLNHEDIVMRLATMVRKKAGDCEAILLPAVLGTNDDHLAQLLIKQVQKPLHFVPTIPPSAPGVRIQHQLRKHFEALGGTFINGDKAVGANFKNQSLLSIETEKLTGTQLQARHFVLATGSFMSRGLVANYEQVCEPTLGLDVDYNDKREQWTSQYVFDPQPYMEFGVKTDSHLRVYKDGKVIDNVYAAGQILSGNNRIAMASSQGVDLLTALAVANNILN